jgi:hypothetical protein
MKKSITFLFVLGAVFSSSAQVFQHAWVSTVRTIGNQANIDVEVDQTGNSYTIGTYDTICDLSSGANTFLGTVISNSQNHPVGMFVKKTDVDGQLLWIKTFRTTYYTFPASIAVDNIGNIIIGGSFADTLDVDPTTSNDFRASTNGGMFLIKMNNLGTVLSAKTFGQAANDISEMIVDAQNNVFITGSYNAVNTDFDPGAGTTLLSPLGEGDAFIAKLTPAFDLVWVKSFGGTSGEGGRNIATDGLGNVYLAGLMSGTGDYDPGAGVVTLTSSNTDLYSSNTFLVKLTAAGVLVWAKNLETSAYSSVYAIAADNNFLYVLGSYDNGTDFDPNVGVQTMNTAVAPWNENAYLLKLSATGNFVSVKTVQDARDGNVILKDGFLYVSGTFLSSGVMVDVDPNATVNMVQTSNGASYIYVQDLASGSTIFSGTATHANTAVGYGSQDIAVDGQGNIFACGIFTGNCDLNITAGTSPITAIEKDGYLYKLSRINPLALSEKSVSAFILFPNPSSSVITISSEFDVKNSRILNLLGEELIQFAYNSAGNQMLDVSVLANGTYIIEMETTKGIDRKSFMKINQ